MPAGNGRVAGARLRSRLNWLILKTVALDIAVPIAAAEAVRIAAAISTRNGGEFWRRLRRPGAVWSYLYRLAAAGRIRLEGLRRRRRATLTPAGRRALEALEARLAGEAAEPAVATANEMLAAERARRTSARSALRGPTADDLRRQRRRARLERLIPGRPRVTAFVSYDVPRAQSSLRRRTLAALRAHGFARLHQSMYTGPSERLRAALEAVEPLGVLPRLRWGTLTVFSP